MKCKGIESYYGPCGASDCSTCNPRSYRKFENPDKQEDEKPARQHRKCGCRLDNCRNCNPEYTCVYCGICFVDEENPDDIPCISRWEKQEETLKRVQELKRLEGLDFDDGLPF